MCRRVAEHEQVLQLLGVLLQQQIDAETKRAEDLKEYEKYTKTAAYVEEVAKDKLGLVYEDEVVFQAEEK